MKKHLPTIILVLLLVLGLSLLLYPSFSNWWNSMTQSRAIAEYDQQVAALDEETYEEIWSAAFRYNESLLGRSNPYLLDEAQRAEYESLLNLDGFGIMGYVEIPGIGVSLPIYHGTSDSVLQVAAGHLDWTSLPVGGEGSHCVLSGHRGLPSARLFTDLDQLREGDLFCLRVLNETLTYEVDQIRIVEPEDTADLRIAPGQDLCTLLTCTPYGINTHRLLVRGHRVETVLEQLPVRVSADAVQVEPMLVASLTAVPILLVLLLVVLIQPRKKRGGDPYEDE